MNALTSSPGKRQRQTAAADRPVRPAGAEPSAWPGAGAGAPSDQARPTQRDRLSVWTPLAAAAGSVAAALLLTLGSPKAQAQTPAEQRIDQRQDRQAQRIEQGVASGELTRREARRLQRQQAGVAAAEARAESDGRLTRREAARLERRQDRTSARIYRQKHDRQERPN